MTTTVTLDEAAEQIRDLLARVERGEEVVIERDGHPIGRLVPDVADAPNKAAGRAQHFGWAREVYGPLNDDWDEPMSDEELALWYGPIFPEETDDDSADGSNEKKWPPGFVELENGVVVTPGGMRFGTGSVEFGPLAALWANATPEKDVPPSDDDDELER